MNNVTTQDGSSRGALVANLLFALGFVFWPTFAWTANPPPTSGHAEQQSPKQVAAQSQPQAVELDPITLTECMRAAKQRRAEIQKNQPGPYSFVFFCGTLPGQLLGYEDRTYGVVGDPVYFAYYGPQQNSVGVSLETAKCAARAGGPVEFSSGKINTAPLQSKQKEEFVWLPEDPLKAVCFNSDAQIHLTGMYGTKNNLEKTYTLTQYERYTFTAQIGVVFTDHVEHGYAVTGGAIRDTGPRGNGPEYFASVVVYGFPNYLLTLGRGPAYYGRDIIHDNGWADRTGLLLGFGLSKPKNQFLAGLSFEVANGIDLIAAHRWARFAQLDGVLVGDAFAGNADAIPKKDVWDKQWVFGVSLDGRYLASLLPGK